MAKPPVNPNQTGADELDELLGKTTETPVDPVSESVQKTSDFTAPTVTPTVDPVPTTTKSSSKKSKSKSSSNSQNMFMTTLLAESNKNSSDALVRAKNAFTAKSRILGYVCGTDAKLDFSLRSTSSKSNQTSSVKEVFIKNSPPTKVESFIVQYPSTLYQKIRTDRQNIHAGQIDGSYDRVDDIVAVITTDKLPEFFRCYTNKALIEDQSIFTRFTKSGTNKVTYEHWGDKVEDLTQAEITAYGELGHPFVYIKTDFYGFIPDPQGAVDSKGHPKYKKVNMKSADLDPTKIVSSMNIKKSSKFISCYRGTRLTAPGNYIPLKKFQVRNFATDTIQYSDAESIALTQAYTKSIWTRLNRTTQAAGSVASQLSSPQSSFFPDCTTDTKAIAVAFAPDPQVRKTYWESTDPQVMIPVEHWYEKDAQGNKVRLTPAQLNLVNRDTEDNNKPKSDTINNQNIGSFVPAALQHLFESTNDSIAKLDVSTLKTSKSRSRTTGVSGQDFSDNLTDEQLDAFLQQWLRPDDRKTVNY